MFKKVLLVIFLLIFLFSAANLGIYFYRNYKADKDFTTVRNASKQTLCDIYKKNNDIVGWIKINGTKVDYPIMQTKKEPEFYLRRNFAKKYSIAGTPFLDFRCDFVNIVRVKPKEYDDEGYKIPKDWLVYGHNMQSGIMFHDLLQYQDERFLATHDIIDVQVLSKDGKKVTRCKFQILGVGFIKAKNRLYQEAEYNKYPDKNVLILSTCDNVTEAGRFIVVAERKE